MFFDKLGYLKMTHLTKLRTSTVSSVEPVILSKIERMILKKPPGLKILTILILIIIAGTGCAVKFGKVNSRSFILPSTDIGLKITSSLLNTITVNSNLTSTYAQILEVLRSRNIGIEIVPLPVSSPNIFNSWNILDKLSEKDDELTKVPVSLGPKEKIYYENRISLLPYDTEPVCIKKHGVWDDVLKVCKSIIRKRFSEKEMVLGLKLLNTETGEISVIKVNTKINTDGVSIVALDGYQIEIVERPNGIKWNLWNTQYQVVTPANTAVIKNNFPRETTEMVSDVVKGRAVKKPKKVVSGFLYVPHSDFFEQDDNKKILVEAGKNHLKNTVSQAFSILRDRGVKSRAFLNKLVADVGELSPRFFERLPLLEQGDFTEFQLDPKKTTERVLIILGANGENAWRYTCNRSSACGWVQFTPRTYSRLRTKFYPSAKLIPDFKEGAGNHVNSIMAAILLHDYNLNGLLKSKKYADKILSDPILREEALDSGYNGDPKWTHNSLAAAISKDLPDWVYALSSTRKGPQGGLRKETRDFMTKLRYLVANDFP